VKTRAKNPIRVAVYVAYFALFGTIQAWLYMNETRKFLAGTEKEEQKIILKMNQACL